MIFGRTGVSRKVGYSKNILKNNDFRSYQSIPKSGILQKRNDKTMIFGCIGVSQKIGYSKKHSEKKQFEVLCLRSEVRGVKCKV